MTCSLCVRFATGNPFKEKILCWCDGLEGGAVAAWDEEERLWQVLVLTIVVQLHCKTSRGLWQHSFCGKLEKGESVAEAAVRELEEESGLQVLETYIFAVEFYLGKH